MKKENYEKKKEKYIFLITKLILFFFKKERKKRRKTFLEENKVKETKNIVLIEKYSLKKERSLNRFK